MVLGWRQLRPILLLAAAVPIRAQDGSLDPAFNKIPFDAWLKETTPPRIRWTLRTNRPVLSIHQRLQVEIELRIDGADLQQRRGKGELLTYLQFTDADGRRYQTHGSIDLAKLDENVKSAYITYTESAFVLPGDYRVAAAIQETVTDEHETRHGSLRVPALKSDPLPESWYRLPPVEFIPASQAPESWYLPSIQGRLHLPVSPKHEVRVDVIANVSPSEQPVGRRRTMPWRPGILVPTLKVVSQTRVRPGTMNVDLLDVLRRKVLFHQTSVRDLDWDAMRPALSETSAGVIDVKALEDRKHDLAFLIAELNKRIEGVDTQPLAMILISNPVEFESTQSLDSGRLIQCRSCRLFYVRVRPPLIPGAQGPMAPPRGGRRMGGGGMGRPIPSYFENAVDHIEPALKPLAPRVFDISSPEQLRKALAAILAEIAAM